MKYTKLNGWASCIVLLAIAALPLQAFSKSKDWKRQSGESASSSVASVASACEDETLMVRMKVGGEGGKKPLVNETLSTTFTGHIKRTKKNRVMVCPGTKVDYAAVSTVGKKAACRLDGMQVKDTGTIKIGKSARKLVCNNKPEGMDKDKYLIIPVKARN